MRESSAYLSRFIKDRVICLRLGVLAFGAVCWVLSMNTAWSQTLVRGIERGAVNLPVLTEQASLIVRATVTNSEVEWVGRTIYTRYDLTVTETIRGNARKQVNMWIPGGANGQVRTVWPGAPELKQSDEIIFFGKPFEKARGRASGNQNQNPVSDGFTPVGLFDGSVQVETDPASGKKIVRARGRPEEVEVFLSEVRNLVRGQRGGR